MVTVEGLTSRKGVRTIRSLARRTIFYIRAQVAARPSLDAVAKRLLSRVPLLDRHLRAAVGSERLFQAQFQAAQPSLERLDAGGPGRKSTDSSARRMLYRFRARLAAQPRLDALVKLSLAWFPWLEQRLRRSVGSERSIQAESQAAQARAGHIVMAGSSPYAESNLDSFPAAQAAARIMADLSPRSRTVYLDLMKALQDIL